MICDNEEMVTVLETVSDGVYRLDADGRFVVLNEALADLTGYRRETLLGRHASVVFEERVATVPESTVEPCRVTASLSTASGASVPCEVRADPVVRDDEFRGSAGVVRERPASVSDGAVERGSESEPRSEPATRNHPDVSERENHPDVSERNRHAADATADRERLEEFTSMVVHELRNPLQLARIALDSLDDGTETAVVDGAEIWDGDPAEHLEESLLRLEEVLDLLETIARVRGRDDGIETEAETELAAVATRTWSTVETDAATIVVDDTRTIPARRTHLRQLLENLFRNCVEHTDGPVTVRVSALEDADEDGFAVSDTGSGIPEAARERVTEAGYTTGTDGTGFGLAFVSRLADAYGWDLEITASASGGARFEFTGLESGAADGR